MLSTLSSSVRSSEYSGITSSSGSSVPCSSCGVTYTTTTPSEGRCSITRANTTSSCRRCSRAARRLASCSAVTEGSWAPLPSVDSSASEEEDEGEESSAAALLSPSVLASSPDASEVGPAEAERPLFSSVSPSPLASSTPLVRSWRRMRAMTRSPGRNRASPRIWVANSTISRFTRSGSLHSLHSRMRSRSDSRVSMRRFISPRCAFLVAMAGEPFCCASSGMERSPLD
mmetsp:Transcript_16125/g.41403  ORF Transcript_16125/g.41403 Transcript_16125/m.41403 type:complete len:229 (-) Transcript_16125:607-1293(-)